MQLLLLGRCCCWASNWLLLQWPAGWAVRGRGKPGGVLSSMGGVLHTCRQAILPLVLWMVVKCRMCGSRWGRLRGRRV